MNVISIGTDRKIFDRESPVRKRMIEYGTLFDELHVIVFAKKSSGFKEEKIAPNVWIYPTNSLSKFLYMHDAVQLGQRVAENQKLGGNVVVTAQDPFETGRAGFKIKNALNAAFQVQVHTDFLSTFFLTGSVLNRIRLNMARTILEEANEIRVVSDRIKRSIREKLPSVSESKIDVLPIYTDASRFNNPAKFDLNDTYPQFNFIILMASRLTAEKNITFALDVFADVLSKHPKTGLVIAGSGPEENVLKKKTRRLGIERSVVFEPWQDDLVSYYKTAQAFLLTSLYEGYGLTLVEAALAGLPIVTADVGIAGDVLIDGKNAFVSPVNDKRAFIDKICKLIIHNALRQSFRAAVQSDIERVLLPSNEEYLKRYKALAEKALNSYHS